MNLKNLRRLRAIAQAAIEPANKVMNKRISVQAKKWSMIEFERRKPVIGSNYHQPTQKCRQESRDRLCEIWTRPRAPLIDIMTMTIPRIRRKKGGSEVTTIGVAAPSYARRAIPNNPKPKKIPVSSPYPFRRCTGNRNMVIPIKNSPKSEMSPLIPKKRYR